MKSIFNAADNQEVVARIGKLSTDSKGQWGKMNVEQMLVHCQVPLEVALGELKLKRGLVGFLFGKMAKKSFTGPKPFKRNLPTDPNFLVRKSENFEKEKQKLSQLVARLGQAGPMGVTQEPHPFFGKLTGQEWDLLMYKHLDHHLTQFGV